MATSATIGRFSNSMATAQTMIAPGQDYCSTYANRLIKGQTAYQVRKPERRLQNRSRIHDPGDWTIAVIRRSEEHTSELQSLMRTPYAVFCLKKQINTSNK